MAEIQMMTAKAPEEGSFEVPFSLDGTPLSINWRLTDAAGNVINGKSTESEPVGTSITIFLEGDDLAITDRGNIKRVVTVWGTYNSLEHGNGKKYSGQVGFLIEEMIGIP